MVPQVLKLIQSDRSIELLEMANRVQADYAVIPMEYEKNSHPNFRRIKVFGTEKSAPHMGYGESAYVVYQRINPAAGPVAK